MARLAALVLAIVAVPHALSAGQITESIDQAIWLKPRGQIEVEEAHVIRFDGARVTSIVRTIPTPSPVIVVFVSAAIDGTLVVLDDEVDDRSAGVQTTSRREVSQLRWSLPPLAGSVHTFSLSYLLWNAVGQDAQGDYFPWRVTPIFPYGRIEHAAVSFALSTPLVLTPEVAGPAEDVRIEGRDKGLMVVARGISARRGLQVRLRFEANSAAGPGLRWQARRDARKTHAVIALPIAAAGLLALAALHRLRRRQGGR